MCPLTSATCPITGAHILAILGAVIASFIFGFLWYGPIFGKTWAGLMGMKIPEDCKGQKPPLSSMLLTLLGVFLTTFVIAFLTHQPSHPCGVGVALFAWAGYYVPVYLSQVAWEKRPWRLFALNAAYALLNLQLIAAIVTHF